MCLNVKILLNCFAGYLSSWSALQRKQCSALEQSIRQNALTAWQEQQEREPNQTTVRFMQKMSDNHYRFFTVSQQGNSLVVAKRGAYGA